MQPSRCSAELAGLDWGVITKNGARGLLADAVIVDLSLFLIGLFDGVSARLHRVR
jgi:hypothetical protein